MRLTYLKVQGFRCFAESQRIEFPPRGIVSIVGSREDGGSSGSGKTSILQAIAYVLGFSSFAAKRQQSWLPDSEDLQVDLGMETEDGTESVEIRRGKKSEAILNGQRVASGATELGSWMLNYFGMPPAQLQTMTFRPQRKGGLFLGLGPAERRVFLASILGFKRFEDLAETLTKEATAIEKRLAVQEAVLAQTAVPPKPADLPTKTLIWSDPFFGGIIDVDDDVRSYMDSYETARLKQEKAIATVGANQQVLRQRLAGLRDAHLERTAELQAAAAAATAEIQPTGVRAFDEALRTADERLVLLEQKSRELDATARILGSKISVDQRALGEARRASDAAEAGLKSAMQLVTSLREQKCHTCGQNWRDENRLRASMEAESLARVELARRHEEASVIVVELASDEQTLSDLEAKRTKVGSGLIQLRAQAQDLRAKQSAEQLEAQRQAEMAREKIRAQWNKEIEDQSRSFYENSSATQAELSDCDLQVSKLMATLQKIEAAADYCRQTVTSARRNNTALAQLWVARQNAEKNVEALTKQIQSLQTELDEKRDLQMATRAFLGAISQEVLAEIRDEANAMLAALPNVAGVGIRFTTETQTDSGALRQEIRAVLTYGSEDDVDAESQLSGGQLTSVELAVDRAVSRVLRRRRGGFRLPAWLALDESFDGLDTQSKEACFEFLGSESLDSQILFIDHASELREAFAATICVARGSDGKSTASIK